MSDNVENETRTQNPIEWFSGVFAIALIGVIAIYALRAYEKVIDVIVKNGFAAPFIAVMVLSNIVFGFVLWQKCRMKWAATFLSIFCFVTVLGTGIAAGYKWAAPLPQIILKLEVWTIHIFYPSVTPQTLELLSSGPDEIQLLMNTGK